MTGQLNVNQFALPGMEEHAHAGAKLLRDNLQFKHEAVTYNRIHRRPDFHRLEAEVVSPEGYRGETAGYLKWLGSSHPAVTTQRAELIGGYAGEIQGVRAHFPREGIASALYGMAMDPNVHTGNDTLPLHSPIRTSRGLAWSAAVGGWDPNGDPVEDRPRHPFEEREEQTAKRRPPEVPGQLQLPT